MKVDFTGQVALITGATRGIGKQIAEDLGDLGAELILTGTQKSQIETLKAQSDRHRGRRYYHCVDFTSEGSTEAFLRELEAYPRIDVCINNAGINRINLITETDLADWEAIIKVNLRAPFLIVRQVGAKMQQQNYGRIVNLSSIFGLLSREKRGAYTMSKYGLRGLTVTGAIELARYNVLVNTVSPGFVLTDLTRNILSEREIHALCAQIPIGRLATPDEISRVVIFLASSLNTYLTGQNIIVDGGYVNV
jgi:3-oxoacyl-[acyl-carrier protein] reductase